VADRIESLAAKARPREKEGIISAAAQEKAESMYRVAGDAVRMGQGRIAATFYKKIIKEHPGTSVAKRAQERLDRLEELGSLRPDSSAKKVQEERKEEALRRRQAENAAKRVREASRVGARASGKMGRHELIAFRRKLGGVVRHLAAAGSFVFVGTDSSLSALRVEDGEPLWHCPIDPDVAASCSRPALCGSGREARVYLVSPNSRVRARNQATGEVLGVYALPAEAATSPIAIRMRRLANRTLLFVGCKGGLVVALDVTGGGIRWRTRVESPKRLDLVATERKILVPAAQGRLVALDAVSGTVLWRSGGAPGEIASNLSVDSERGLVGFVSSLGKMHAFSVVDGRTVSQVVLDGVRGERVTLSSGVAYITCDDGSIRAAEVRTTRWLWVSGRGTAAYRELVVRGEDVYVGTKAGALLCLDSRSGKACWRLDTGSEICAPAVICGDKLLLATRKGDILGVDIPPRRARPRSK
jgi:outer membrane protein assembly factor BamB